MKYRTKYRFILPFLVATVFLESHTITRVACLALIARFKALRNAAQWHQYNKCYLVRYQQNSFVVPCARSFAFWAWRREEKRYKSNWPKSLSCWKLLNFFLTLLPPVSQWVSRVESRSHWETRTDGYLGACFLYSRYLHHNRSLLKQAPVLLKPS